jgi:ATP-binding cassette, subfamily F, member 3
VDAAAAEAADALKEKAQKGRPSAGRVRIDTNVQPGYVRLALEKVTVNFKNQDVLTDATWQVQTGDRVGLVGANGGVFVCWFVCVCV